jgi:putative DNA modification/repair radical SAM protein
MDIESKLRILADAAKYDASCASSGSTRKRPDGGLGNGAGVGICHSYTPDGRCISLLKILLTNYCVYDCSYCVNRVSSDTPRARFLPHEIVTLTIEFYKRNYIEGLFLSSGVIQSADYTMEQLVQVARSLRVEHRFGGYIHLKAVPGASRELLIEAGKWADRLSANIELPTQADLNKLAPAKSHDEIETSMGQIRDGIAEAKETRQHFAAGQSTQMVVGATDTTDATILNTASHLYSLHRLKRVYYSGFSPIPFSDARLPVQRVPLVREHRLYQADWLMRFYGFDASELTEPDRPNLSLDRDPKLDWALRNRHCFPVDVNRASQEEMLRIPGFGVRNVQRILKIRKYTRLRMQDLRCLRIPLNRAKPFIVTADHNPSVLHLDRISLPDRFRQMSLFDSTIASVTGEL